MVRVMYSVGLTPGGIRDSGLGGPHTVVLGVPRPNGNGAYRPQELPRRLLEFGHVEPMGLWIHVSLITASRGSYGSGRTAAAAVIMSTEPCSSSFILSISSAWHTLY